MQLWRTKLSLLAGAAALLVALPALGQRERRPQPLLPPGFGDTTTVQPKETPPPSPPAPPAPPVSAVPPPAADSNQSSEAIPTDENAASGENATDGLVASAPPAIEIPESARRSTAMVGMLEPGNWGLGANEFGNANGIFLAALMRRMQAPLPSRWTSILLRRALVSRIPAPGGVNEVDWVAERAWLLLRMGEADAARMLVQSVDVDRYTPRMFTVAVQVALASADPAALCPLVAPGRAVSDEPVWPLADAMCASLQGDSARASQLIDQARGQSGAGGIDILLAEKVIGAGLNTRRAVAIQWDGVDSLNSWRFGLASATGLKIPDGLMNGVGPQVWAWEARAPMIPLADRVEAAQIAASLGVFSHASLVEIFSQIADETDPADLEASVGGRLRKAFIAADADDRVKAMRDLWDEAKTPADRHARLILTASAAARIAPTQARAELAADLIASMLTAGLDQAASRWAGVASAMGNGGDRAWALIAVGAERPNVDTGASRVQAFVKRADAQRGRMLVAALAGLGRLQDPAAFGVDPVPRSRWQGMIAAAARNHQPGTVALLAGVGMQTSDWRGVPPEHLYQIVSALHRVGMDYEARMIAAEAMTRL
jgi:hypothetical protein